MRILFIVLPQLIMQRDAKEPRTRSFKAFPYGVLSVATYLKRHATKQIDIKLIDCNVFDDWNKAIKYTLSDFEPDVVGLSMLYDSSYQHLGDISKQIKDHNSSMLVVLGGSAASFSYKEILAEQDFIDAICYTEGEIPVTDLVNSDDPWSCLENHKSWITRESYQAGKIPEKSFIENLDEVIDIDYDYVKIDDYTMLEAFSPFNTDVSDVSVAINKKQFFLVTSRGCPFHCIFCSTCSGLYENKIRYASIDKTIAHVRRLVTEYGMNVLTIYDDQLLMNRARAKELFRQLAQFNLRIECPNGLSPAFIDDELAGLMRKAGMDTIILAIEHGSERMLRKIIHKPVDLKTIKPLVEILRKYNFFIESFFVIGIPGEIEYDRELTMEFIRQIGFDWCGMNVATPLRGSRLYDLCIENGYIPRDLKIGDIRMQDKKYIIRAPGLEPEEITKKTYLMNLESNFVNNYRIKTGDYQVAANCFRDVIRRTKNHAFAYYYLAIANEAIYNAPDPINRIKYFEIIQKDPVWKEYAEHFKLEVL